MSFYRWHEVERILRKPRTELDAEDLRTLAIEDREHGDCECENQQEIAGILAAKFGQGFKHSQVIAVCESWINEEPDETPLNEQEDPEGFTPDGLLEVLLKEGV